MTAPALLLSLLLGPAARAQETAAAPVSRVNAVAAPLPAADCGALSGLAPADRPSDFLSGRFRLSLPAEAVHANVPNDLMAAAVPEETSSLYFLEQGDDRMGVVANETFQLAGDDLEGAVRRYLSDLPEEGAPWNIAPLPLADPSLRAVAYWPSSLVIRGDSDVWALGVLYAMPDGGVAHVSFRMDTPTAAHGTGCTGYAAQLASSAIAGDRPLGRAARDETVAVTDGRSLIIHVPADAVLLPQPGPDFLVFYIIPLVPLDQPSPSLGIYVGAYPQDLEPSNLPDVPGELLGEKGAWLASDVAALDGSFHALRLERRLELSPKKKKKRKGDADPAPTGTLYVHVFMSAADQAQLDALRAVAESLEWARGG